MRRNTWVLCVLASMSAAVSARATELKSVNFKVVTGDMNSFHGHGTKNETSWRARGATRLDIYDTDAMKRSSKGLYFSKTIERAFEPLISLNATRLRLSDLLGTV